MKKEGQWVTLRSPSKKNLSRDTWDRQLQIQCFCLFFSVLTCQPQHFVSNCLNCTEILSRRKVSIRNVWSYWLHWDLGLMITYMIGSAFLTGFHAEQSRFYLDRWSDLSTLLDRWMPVNHGHPQSVSKRRDAFQNGRQTEDKQYWSYNELRNPTPSEYVMSSRRGRETIRTDRAPFVHFRL